MTVGQIVAFTNYLLTTMTPADHDDHAVQHVGSRHRLGTTGE